jgi:hypothetical protein
MMRFSVSALTFFIPFIVTYAIVSDLGKPQHTYSGASRTALVNQNLP